MRSAFSLFLILSSSFLLFSVQAQQKLSLGVQGGLITPLGIRPEGNPPGGLKPELSSDFSKAIFLQYDLSDNFFVRGSFKQTGLTLKNRLKYKQADTLKNDGSYSAAFHNRQLELSLGYRKILNEKWSLSASLGATYLDMKITGDRDLQLYFPFPEEPYFAFQAPVVVKEKSVLLNAALGLEYKTRRDNVFSLEVGYYKGFETVADYRFKMVEKYSQEPVAPVFQSSLKSKGDYAEIRLGYRMPVQKFTNLYKAINTPRIKPVPEPDTIRQARFTGKYWGLETAKQTFYANQVQELPGYSDKMQVSAWTLSLTFYKGYQFKSGLSLEGGIRIGTVNNYASAEATVGVGTGWSNWLLTTPVSVKYSIPVLRNKIYLTPEAGLWQSYSAGMGETDTYWPLDGRIGEFDNIVTHAKGYGHDYFVGYHAGLSLNGRVGKTTEIGIGYRFADRFTDKPLFLNEVTYDRNNIPQPAIVAKSRLQNDMITISFRKFLKHK